MALKDIFNKVDSIGTKISSAINHPLSSLFAAHYVRPQVDRNKIGEYIMQLESNMGTHPNTAPDVPRSFTIPAANANEKDRTIPYQVGYGGYAGITPVALGEFHKSQYDRNAPVASSTPQGVPLLPGRDVDRSLKMLRNLEDTKKLTAEMFNSKKTFKDDWYPETLADDYMNNWVGKGTVNYTPENRARVLKFFKDLLANQ